MSNNILKLGTDFVENILTSSYYKEIARNMINDLQDKKLYVWNKTGMRMLLNTDYKTFNKQTNCISSGNVIANTEIGWHIRPKNEISCNGKDFELGELRNHDLSCLELNNFISAEQYVKEITEKNGCYVYQLRTFNNGNEHFFATIVEQKGKYKIFLNNSNVNMARAIKYYKTCLYVVFVLENDKI